MAGAKNESSELPRQTRPDGSSTSATNSAYGSTRATSPAKPSRTPRSLNRRPPCPVSSGDAEVLRPPSVHEWRPRRAAEEAARAASSARATVDTAERLLDRDLEASDDSGVAASREELGIGIACGHPGISLFGVGDDVRKAPGADREDLSGFPGGVAERVEAGTSLGAEDEVSRSQLLCAVWVPEDGTTTQHEEHLFGSEVHVHPHLGRVGSQFVQRCSHPGVVRPPEDSMPSPGFVVLSVPCVGEEVLTIHRGTSES